MSPHVLQLAVGVRVAYDGDVVEVVELDGSRVTVRNDRTRRFTVLRLSTLIDGCRPVEVEAAPQPQESVGAMFAALTCEQQREVAERAGHVREVLTGYRSGHAGAAAPGEPRDLYRADVALVSRYESKAAELGLTVRTVQRWVGAYRRDGEAGLVDVRALTGRGARVDARWEDALGAVLAEAVGDSTPTRGAVLAKVAARVEQEHGPGVVPLPSTATAYRRLAALTKGTNAVRGSAKGRRSIAERPQGTFGRLRATRPGEYLVLDTQDLDVFAMEEVSCRWVPVQLTIAQDLFTRCVMGLRVTPISTKAIDVAGVLYQSMVPHPAPPSWPAGACWPYHGVPQHVVFDELTPCRAPVCAPETLVVDHGKVFLSQHVLSVCTRLGISIQPAQPHKPTDKPTCERFFKTLREGLIQHLPAYKGPDVYSRGERVEDEAFLFVHELEDVVREWVALIYHCSKHAGLRVPQWPHLDLSPNEMFEVGIAKAGMLRIPVTPGLAYDFLPVAARTVQHYGVEVNGLRYNGPALDPYRNLDSPYGGTLSGKWPIRFNPDDVRYVYFCDPADQQWHALAWEHEAGLDTPFSLEASRHARRLAITAGDGGDTGGALAQLLARWDKGVLEGTRAERRMAIRLASEYAALPHAEPCSPGPDRPDQPGPVKQPSTAAADVGAAATAPGGIDGTGVALLGDDDECDADAGEGGGGDFYADAFEVL